MATALTATSCIFEEPDDRFYRTLWESTDMPLGPFEIDELTLEFLCGQSVSLKTDSNTIIAHGTYSCDDQTAIFSGLIVELDGHIITFIDAERHGDTLFLRWRIENSIYPFTTPMHRPSEYK
jgi:hypothetical protein